MNKLDKKKTDDKSNDVENLESNLKYFNNLIEFLFIILRNNLTMVRLAFTSEKYFRNEYKDQIFEQFYKKEKAKFDNMIKTEIIHIIVQGNNMLEREAILKYFDSYEYDLDKNIVNDVLKENCDEIVSVNQLKMYSVKNDKLLNFDLDNVYDVTGRSNALKYLTEFHSKNYNILNTKFPPSLSIQTKLNKKIFDYIFKKENIDKFFNCYEYLLKFGHETLNNIFFPNLSKILCIFMKSPNYNELEYNQKILNIFDDIDNKFEGVSKELVQYIRNSILHNNNNNNLIEEKKGPKNKYKERLKKKFEEKLSKFEIPKDILEQDDNKIEKNSDKICVFCRQGLNSNLDKCYGKICYLLKDKFIDKLKNVDSKSKSLRIFTCNHFIHQTCYTQMLINSNVLNKFRFNFGCLICKKLSNSIICDLSRLIQDNEYFKNCMKGFNDINSIVLDEKGLYLKDDESIKDLDFLQLNMNFLEDFSTKLIEDETLIEHLKNLEKFKQIYDLIIKEFESFTLYYNITNYKIDQIYLWKNILLNIRLLNKCKVLNFFDYIVGEFKSIKEKIIARNEFDDDTLINKYILAATILFELNDDNKEKVKQFFKQYILLYMFKYAIIFSKVDSVEKFFKNEANKDLTEKIFNLYKLKYQICLLFFGEQEDKLEINFDESINFVKKELKEVIPIDNIAIKQIYLDLPKFKFIDLPNNMFDFYSKNMSLPCSMCKNKNVAFMICLSCGAKICDSTSCIFEDKTLKKPDFSFIYHSKVCSGGNSIFIKGITGKIVFLLKRRLIESKYYIYLNSYGEYPKSINLTDNYIRNKIELENAYKAYVDMTYRVNKGIFLTLEEMEFLERLRGLMDNQ